MQKYVSEIKYIDHSQEVIYNYLSDFENLSRYVGDDLLSSLNEKIPQLKINNFESDRDSCRFEVSGVQAAINIVEREPAKLIKLSSTGGLPVEATLWIQLLPVLADRTKMRLTLHAEMNMMVKMMVHKKLEKGIDQMAEALTKLPYR